MLLDICEKQALGFTTAVPHVTVAVACDETFGKNSIGGQHKSGCKSAITHCTYGNVTPARATPAADIGGDIIWTSCQLWHRAKSLKSEVTILQVYISKTVFSLVEEDIYPRFHLNACLIFFFKQIN